jgi:glycosyltransferase involved in cell wall biosynthesis
VVPCYRCTATIERAVKSVAAQTARPAEMILVDDASPDGTAAHLDSLRDQYGADWIRVIRLTENGGPASARNAGWEAARQKYVAFLDSDDAWHPSKVEIQLAWMEAHPDVSVTGHGAVQLGSVDDIPMDPGAGEAKPVSKAALYAANRFVTPSVMLRRDIPQRFEPGARHMEDYLLWLEIAEAGHRIAKLPHVLAYTFKAPYGEAGLSAQLWNMEKGELRAFSKLRRNRQIGATTWLALCGYSLAKFVRRMLMMSAGYSPGGNQPRPSMVYAGSYLLVTQAMTALLICAGLLGRSELAADIAVVQAATLATFFSFSGNARNLILTLRTPVPREALLAARLILLLPLGAASVLLCIAVAHVEATLALILIARRGVEWIAELHLSECELLGKRSTAVATLLMQGVLLLAVIFAAGFAQGWLLWLLGAWALIPLVPILGFIGRGVLPGLGHLPAASRLMLPHIGSTAVSGVSLYAFRALLVLIAGKPLAGSLFTAFAIGSFPGSLFANVLGPSIALHEERTRRSYLPKALWLALLAYLAGGLAILAAAALLPQALDWEASSRLFWAAVGISLLGGAIMLIAQRFRVRLLTAGAGDAVFAADVLMYMSLIAAVPALYATGRPEALAALYLLNALLALAFYVTTRRGLLERLWPVARGHAAFVLVLLVFLPLFFYASGGLFNPREAAYDSGGVLATLPLPVSLLACTAGLLLLGRYDAGASALWTMLGLLCLMLVSTAVMHGGAPLERAKLLLLLQIVLPMFGLVLGTAVYGSARNWSSIAGAILTVAAVVVPVQLAITLASGTYTLSHSLGLFGVYQHLQFVPVVVTSAFLLVLPHFWERSRWRGRMALTVLAMLMGMYAVAALSVLSIFAMLAGTLLLAAMRFWRSRDLGAIALAILVAASGMSFGYLSRNSDAFHNKFDFFFPRPDPWVTVIHTDRATPTLTGQWNLAAKPTDVHLMKIALPIYARRGTLIVTGQLIDGELGFRVEHVPSNEFRLRTSVSAPGFFEKRLEVDLDRTDGHVLIGQVGQSLRATILSLRWEYPPNYAEHVRDKGAPGPEPATAATDAPALPAPEAGSGFATRVRNIQERFSDWTRFGAGIFDSPATVFFGHPAPLPRDQRTSAHNFYIDFAYNFGLLALAPLLLLIYYTVAKAWQHRSSLSARDGLLPLCIIVAFLVIMESSLKVTLRQPYPGIAIYFLWGILLAMLNQLDSRREGKPTLQ